MTKHLSSVKNAKDTMTLHDLDDLDLAMKAEARFAKREQIMQPRKPIRLSRYGLFIAGLTAGAMFALLIAFVIKTTGPISGIMLVIGIAMILGVIGANIEGVDE